MESPTGATSIVDYFVYFVYFPLGFTNASGFRGALLILNHGVSVWGEASPAYRIHGIDDAVMDAVCEGKVGIWLVYRLRKVVFFGYRKCDLCSTKMTGTW
uniref:Uncharacterized protein n=1 Tax=Candidatus Kentrum sp. MB TaxID=2138164 RepID=A0A451BE64_9GAMM|nr:MAG: hypothetical protein BECKMB1821G_GA0114241_10933 [Candidatus Kentron sp. MB]VFK34067.1 MAG: hypothetical protein BECKMB1821I_GA0114274_106013 [Candidatus Kentron sp. MB]VFK76569.1 MAG: hypothetical protein BECKMB1821H_GA0114242_106315 [Candidatus Kentron sp. MB]